MVDRLNWLDKFLLRKRANHRQQIHDFYMSRAKEQEDKESAVNIIDMPSDGEVEGREQISVPGRFPNTIQDETDQGPEFDQFRQRRQAEIGFELAELTTEREHGKPNQKLTQHGMWPDSYTDENKFEDTDKLGDKDVDSLSESVRPPYSLETPGAVESRYDDPPKDKYKITLHASEEIDPNAGPHQFWLAVDLDGTILEPPNDYEYGGEHQFGTPLPGAKEALQEIIDGGAKVSIWTARQYFADTPEEEDRLVMAVEDVLNEHSIPFTDIYVGKKPPAHHFIDDRNISFNGDWEQVLDAVRDDLKKEANDPIKDTINYKGIEIDIEWPEGSIRSYEGDDTYVTHMKCGYGYARGIEGNDGEELDIYLVDGNSDTAFIIEQLKDDGSYDEDKIVLGVGSEQEAAEIYLAHMPAYMLGPIRAVPVDKLVNALYGGPEDRRGEEDLVPSEEKTARYITESELSKYKDGGVFDPKIEKKPKSDYVGPQTSQVGGIGGVGADSEEWVDQLPGGLADDKKPLDFDIEALKDGIYVELEHVNDREIAMEIAMDHLTEDPQYYTKLRTIESSVFPGNPKDEDEFTDVDETRENRDIPRDQETEKMKYRNA
jgi:hypothetical protein